jgi:DNA repair photolyase
VITKSDLVLRDIDVLKRISRVSAAVSLTITSAEDAIAKAVEPGAPPSSARFRALRKLNQAGIEVRVALMPTLPYIEDSWENVSFIIEEAHRCGATVVIPWFGMTLRDRQREYFYARLDEFFPGLRSRYEAAFREDYLCASPRAKDLNERAQRLCSMLGMATCVQPMLAQTAWELPLFGS